MHFKKNKKKRNITKSKEEYSGLDFEDQEEKKEENDESYRTLDDVIEKLIEVDVISLDAYQLLAFRRLDPKSHTVRRVFETYPYILTVSAYNRWIVVCLVVASLQVFGFTVIVYAVVNDYLFGGMVGSQCDFQISVWKKDWYFKIAAFLWAVVISLSIHVYTKDIFHRGLNQLLTLTQYYDELSTLVDFTALQLGVLINLYTLIVAVFGSFFLIYMSEGGVDAVSMILDSVALLFMIKLDDSMVSREDVKDFQKIVRKFRKIHLAELKKEIYSIDAVSENMLVGNNNNRYSQCFSKELTLKCIKGGVFLRRLLQGFIILYAMLAPWAILVCW